MFCAIQTFCHYNLPKLLGNFHFQYEALIVFVDESFESSQLITKLVNF